VAAQPEFIPGSLVGLGGAVTSRLYEIHVRGRVPLEELAELEGVTAQEEPLVTVLRGSIADQAALHGVLMRLQGLGLDLIELHRLETQPEGA
jgi:hypothetical protein